MTNEEKAIELVKQFQSCINNGVSIDAAVMACLMEMAEWKEKQMIERACNLYRDELIQFNNLLSHLNSDYDGLVDIEKSIKSFKKAIEE